MRYSSSRLALRAELRLLNSCKENVRKSCYRDLLDFAQRVSGYGFGAVAEFAGFKSADPEQVIYARILVEELERALNFAVQDYGPDPRPSH